MIKLFLPTIILLLLPLSLSCSHSKEEHNHGEESEHHESEGIHLEEEEAARFGIEFEKASPGTFRDVIKTSGSVEASSADVYYITARKSGIITLNPGITQGSIIKSGERIASISGAGVQGGDADKAALANLDAARSEYERLKPLYEDGLVTASSFREAERAYREAEALAGGPKASGASAVISPAGGAIISLDVNSGQFVDVGAKIATVAKNSSMVLKAYLPAREVAHLPDITSANFIPEGSGKVINIEEADGKKISGNSSVSAANGYIPVYFSFSANPLNAPGGYAEVFLLCGPRSGVISVPREALLEIQGNKYIYTTSDRHSYEKQLVETGASDGRRVEILSGLNEGEQYVSKGASIIRMAEVSAIAPESHTHSH